MNPHTFPQNSCLAHEEKPPLAGLEGASLSKTCFIQEIEKIKIEKKKKKLKFFLNFFYCACPKKKKRCVLAVSCAVVGNKGS